MAFSQLKQAEISYVGLERWLSHLVSNLGDIAQLIITLTLDAEQYDLVGLKIPKKYLSGLKGKKRSSRSKLLKKMSGLYKSGATIPASMFRARVK